MKHEIVKQYKPYRPVDLPDRTWPDKNIETAPFWCSVDLRDGNQSLIIPMNFQEKLDMFRLLVEIGFKEIEVGFPSASEVEYKFLRTLIEDQLIPDDVTVQVLTQAREHLIQKTFEALKGCRRAVLHIYNSTSELQRRVVFNMDKKEIREIATSGVRFVKKMAADIDTEIVLEYSPESFTGTELDYAVEVCDAVLDEWQPSESQKAIINLPATVEMTSPNIFADQIEYFVRHLKNRNRAVISIHAHNDRGSAVAASELALLAGGDRIEGTLFGNGERTGNADIVTIALNMFSRGVDPGLDFHNINRIIEIYERTTRMPVHPRHPYAGELVYTAFSGSHQDAINKGMDYRRKNSIPFWEVPYLPINPEDLGRTYESIIRINSQSGKGGVAYVMDHEYGFQLPKSMHPEFGKVIQNIADKTGGEILPELILKTFEDEFLNSISPYQLISFVTYPDSANEEDVDCKLEISIQGEKRILEGRGNGPIDACKDALIQAGLFPYSIEAYSEHALAHGSDSRAAAYIQLQTESQKTYYGAGVDHSITRASIRALICAMNRIHKYEASGKVLEEKNA
ncbi:MAG: 2-isopropylmalate synthase [Spirochaetia bacterium]|nr:2-isopropylmalate synthase [Spirochaetia bacterium]